MNMTVLYNANKLLGVVIIC